MKRKIFLLLIFLAISLSGMAQNVGDALFVFRNDGEFHAFFSDEIVSIEYSNEDEEGNVYDDIVTQIITTPDSVYMFPLAVIDSISFVRPETIYREDVTVIPNQLLDYVIAVDENILTLSSSTPSSIVPIVGDKLVAFELSDKLPYGFIGKVQQVDTNSTGIVLTCEYIKPEDVAKRFYGIYKIMTENGSASPLLKNQQSRAYFETVDIGKLTVPIEISETIFKKEDVMCFSAKAGGDFSVSPTVDMTLTITVDDILLLSNTSLHVVTDFNTTEDFELAGEVLVEFKERLAQIPPVMIPGGIKYYLEGGVKASGSGELALGVTFTEQSRHVLDIKYYPYAPFLSRIMQSFDIKDSDSDWHYLAGRTTTKFGFYLETGFAFLDQDITKIGGEVDFGIRDITEFMFNWDEIGQAWNSPELYESLNNIYNIDIDTYLGAYIVADAFDDLLHFQLGKDWELPWKIYQGRLLPTFDEVTAEWIDDSSAKVSAKITNDCFLPWKVGFAIFDSNNELIDYYYHPDMYLNNTFSFSEFDHTFTNLNSNKKHIVYPIIELFEHGILATPSKELNSMNLLDCPDENHPHMIDMGLPSGTKWACCNVGANTPEEYGLGYAWGETVEKSEYHWDNYLYGYYDEVNEQCVGIDIGMDISNTEYDAAYVIWGDTCHMPTKAQFSELSNSQYVRSKTESINGVTGLLLTSKTNGNKIFLPALTFIDYWGDTRTAAGYWTSNIYDYYEQNPTSQYAWAFVFSYPYFAYLHSDNIQRFNGYRIRPVSE